MRNRGGSGSAPSTTASKGLTASFRWSSWGATWNREPSFPLGGPGPHSCWEVRGILGTHFARSGPPSRTRAFHLVPEDRSSAPRRGKATTAPSTLGGGKIRRPIVLALGPLPWRTTGRGVLEMNETPRRGGALRRSTWNRGGEARERC